MEGRRKGGERGREVVEERWREGGGGNQTCSYLASTERSEVVGSAGASLRSSIHP